MQLQLPPRRVLCAEGPAAIRELGEAHTLPSRKRRDRTSLDFCQIGAGNLQQQFAMATPLYREVDDGSGLPHLKLPLGNSFLVKDILTDFKRHD
jgi:hypothetical protein